MGIIITHEVVLILNEIIHVNYLAQCLAQSKHTENKGLGYAHT